MTIFDEASTRRIRDKVAEIESQTAGEVVVALAQRSHDYHGTRAVFALALAVVAGTLGLSALGPDDGDYVLLAELLAGASGFWLSGVPPVLRRLVPGSFVEAAVRARALSTFVERGVHHTRDASGILVFISEDEHAAVILGDRGIHHRVGERGWSEALQKLLSALRGGQAEQGLLALLSDMGEVLAREFPPRKDDENELPDEVVKVPRR